MAHVYGRPHIRISLYTHVKYGYGELVFVHVTWITDQEKAKLHKNNPSKIFTSKSSEHQKKPQSGLVENCRFPVVIFPAKSLTYPVISIQVSFGNYRDGTNDT